MIRISSLYLHQRLDLRRRAEQVRLVRDQPGVYQSADHALVVSEADAVRVHRGIAGAGWRALVAGLDDRLEKGLNEEELAATVGVGHLLLPVCAARPAGRG